MSEPLNRTIQPLIAAFTPRVSGESFGHAVSISWVQAFFQREFAQRPAAGLVSTQPEEERKPGGKGLVTREAFTFETVCKLMSGMNTSNHRHLLSRWPYLRVAQHGLDDYPPLVGDPWKAGTQEYQHVLRWAGVGSQGGHHGSACEDESGEGSSPLVNRRAKVQRRYQPNINTLYLMELRGFQWGSRQERTPGLP